MGKARGILSWLPLVALILAPRPAAPGSMVSRAQALYEDAQRLVSQGDTQGAIAMLGQSLDLDPSNALAHITMASLAGPGASIHASAAAQAASIPIPQDPASRARRGAVAHYLTALIFAAGAGFEASGVHHNIAVGLDTIARSVSDGA
jgi:hypothetical protein